MAFKVNNDQVIHDDKLGDLANLKIDTTLVLEGDGAGNVTLKNVIIDSASIDTSLLTTDDIAEGVVNQYYTDTRVQAISINSVSEDTAPQLSNPLDANNNVINNLANPVLTSDSATKGYVDSAVSSGTGSLITDDIAEGTTNLYYTDARVGLYLTTNSYATETYADTAEAEAILTANTYTNSQVTKTVIDTLNIEAASVQANSVTLGTDTTGNYIQTIAGTASEIEITGSGTESADVTIGLPANVTVPNNLTVSGDLYVSGTTISVDSATLSVDDPFIYLNQGDAIGETGTVFTGTGLDDAVFHGYYEGSTTTIYYVRIDGTGATDTFEWSKDNFVTTEATGVAITGLNQDLDNNITIEFSAITGHTLGDVWSGIAAPVNIDTGLFSNINTGTIGIGYTHVGIFFDASDSRWKVFSEYDAEPNGDIITSDPSFVLGIMEADCFVATEVDTGYVLISDAVTLNNHAATKLYVDTAETDAISTANAYTDQAETDARAYTDTRETAITSAYQSYTDNQITNLDSVYASISGETFTGNVSAPSFIGPLSGNASSATSLETARNINLSGDVTGTASFNGTSDITITATVANDSHTHDGRYYTESESDARFVNVAGDTMTGNLNVTGEIIATGDVTAYSTSDERLKTKLEPIDDALIKLQKLNGYTFNWNELAENKDVSVRQAGVMAQDVEMVLPEAVIDRENGYKAVKYEQLIPLLIEALKEQQQQIDDLKEKIKKK